MASHFRSLSVAAITCLGAACAGGGFVQPPFLGSVNGAVSPGGAVGSQVILGGLNFGSTQGTSQVLFTNAVGGLTVVGTIASPSDWTDQYIVTTVPAGAFSGAVAVQNSGGTSSPFPFSVTPSLPNVPFTPSAVSWTAGNSLPAGVSGNAVAFARVRVAGTGSDTGFVYAVGGADNTGTPTAAVYYAAVATNGSLGAWTATTAPLPQARAFHAAVAATPRNSYAPSPGYLYVLGGVNASGTTVDIIYRGTLSATGDVSGWTVIQSLPTPLHSMSALIYLGSLYMVGGANNSNGTVPVVYRTAIQTDGSLSVGSSGVWSAQASLPAPRARLGVGAYRLHLYAIGGDSATLTPNDSSAASERATVFFGSVSPSTHNVASWTSAGTLETARSAHTAIIAGGNVLLTGGLYSGAVTGTNEGSYAALSATDGTVGTFMVATGTSTIQSVCSCNLFNHAATGYLAGSGSNVTFHVLVVGGDDVKALGTKRAETYTY